MNEIFEKTEKPIAFKVSDMLRAKCMFIDVDKINACCSEIISAVEKDSNLKLIEVDNRLRMGTSDITLKILFGNVISEIQLAINMRVSDYEFNHKIYELKRSLFTQLCQLSLLNEKIAQEYC
jgi:hypothetical protein